MTEPITIVSGLPRSGTSLMMQMLAAGGLPALTDEIRAADEDNPRGYLEFEPVKKTRQDPSWLERAPGKAVKMVYLLLRDLPATHRYRVIMMNRALPEVIASQQAMLVRSGKTGANLPPEKMASIFAGQLAQTSRWLAAQPNFETLAVNHRECIEHPAAAATAVNTFLGGHLDPSARAAAVDPALYRQRS